MSKTARKQFTTEIVYEEKDKPSKIDKWDWNAVKNALDDSTRKFLTSQVEFKEDHVLMDVRLVISTVAIVFSLTAIVYDYLHPFPKSKWVMLVCVIAYFITIGILQYYTTYIEKGCVVAIKQNADDSSWTKYTAYSKSKKYDSEYVLDVELSSLSSKKRVFTFKKSLGTYFDVDGNLLVEKYHADLCKFFEKISQDKKDR